MAATPLFEKHVETPWVIQHPNEISKLVLPLIGGNLSNYKFIDLFAGIGGFHLAFSKVGAKCVFASEWDAEARATYEANFKSDSPRLFTGGNFAGDITKIDKS